MAQNRGRNQANKSAWSFGDFAKYIQSGLPNPVFIDAASFNPLLSQVFPTRTEEQSCNPAKSRHVRGASNHATSAKKQTRSAPEGQKRYNYTKLPSNDEYPPSYDECVQPGYTSLK